MTAVLVVIGLAALLGAVYAAGFAVHEWKWTQRERQIRWGGPADRTLPDRLAQYQIEAEHPEETITPIERFTE